MMEVFLSWSKYSSGEVARALKSWLPDVFSDVNGWMSSTDIGAGTTWEVELADALKRCQFGIMCLTPENVDSPWLVFEAGALSASLASGRIVPLLFEVNPVDLRYPLAQFQSVVANESGIRQLIDGINDRTLSPASARQLDDVYSRSWPRLSAMLSQVLPTVSGQAARTNRDLLEEAVVLLRGIANLPQPGPVFNQLYTYRVRKRVYEVVASDVDYMVTEDLAVVKQQVQRRLESVVNPEEEEHLERILGLAHCELLKRAGLSEISRLGTHQLVALIDEAYAKLKYLPHGAERAALEARVVLADEERTNRAKHGYGPAF